MSWSLSEARALAVKAARGSGLPWGLAEEAGFAVYWLQARGAPGVEALAALLDARQGRDVDPALCPVHRGTAIADGASVFPPELSQIEQPLLLLPFLAQAAFPKGVLLRWENIKVIGSKLGIPCENITQNLLRDMAQCTCETISAPTNAECYTRVPSAAGNAMNRLTMHAHKTYAPATEQSRLAGAGAGTTDND